LLYASGIAVQYKLNKTKILISKVPDASDTTGENRQ